MRRRRRSGRVVKIPNARTRRGWLEGEATERRSYYYFNAHLERLDTLAYVNLDLLTVALNSRSIFSSLSVLTPEFICPQLTKTLVHTAHILTLYTFISTYIHTLHLVSCIRGEWKTRVYEPPAAKWFRFCRNMNHKNGLTPRAPFRTYLSNSPSLPLFALLSPVSVGYAHQLGHAAPMIDSS